jgi:hypothetical protein
MSVVRDGGDLGFGAAVDPTDARKLVRRRSDESVVFQDAQ